MPSFSIVLQGKLLALVSTDGLELFSIHVSGTRVDDELACVEAHGGVYSEEGKQSHLIWINSAPIRRGDQVEVAFSEDGENSHLGKTIEELYPDHSSDNGPDPKPVDQIYEELRQRSTVRDCFNFEVRLPSGETRLFSSLPDEHGFGFHVLWQSGRPDLARASLHTYTIDYLEQNEPGNDHVSEFLKLGDAIAVKVDGGSLH